MCLGKRGLGQQNGRRWRRRRVAPKEVRNIAAAHPRAWVSHGGHERAERIEVVEEVAIKVAV